MPAAALPVDWNEVRTVARAVGVREAARRFDISEDAARQRSSREGWFADRNEAREQLDSLSQQREKALSTLHNGNVTIVTAADVLDHRQHGKPSREYAARAAKNGLKRLADASDENPAQMTDPENVSALVGLVKVANTVHGWSGSAQPATIRLELLARGAGNGPVIDAEMTVESVVTDGEDEG